ncbi:FtsX-like permease family protein [Bacillus suaedae]|uniref:ABC transporter permease n=1 Tax=Halalkalibacter suaedae TaxID=2822140 RepID=A0A940X0C0_9BACI|nr:FtsX-like permease family protein [Bacillus suaedae]MBP3951834.1 ABC transporter permease [Bacillus suaedae]
MFTLRAISLKLFRASLPTTIVTILTIAVSTCLIMTMMLYSINAKNHMQEQIYQLYGNVDLTAGYNLEQTTYLTTNQLDRITQLDGIEALSKISLAFTSVEGVSDEVYTLGVENDDLVQSRYHHTKDLTNNDVVVSSALAEVLNVQVGGQLQVEGSLFTVREVISFEDIHSEAPKLILLSNDVVKKWMSSTSEGEALFALIKAADKANATELAVAIKKLDDTLRVEITDEDPFVKMNMQSLSIFIMVLSVMVLCITGVLLLTNFQLLLYKMKQQFIIMRSIGASSKQVAKLVQAQLTTINVIGVITGTILTFFALRYGLDYFVAYLQLPDSKQTFLIGPAMIIAFVCFLVLQIFVFIQVQKSLKILPMQLMADNERLDFSFSKTKRFMLKFLGGLALFLILFSRIIPDSNGKGSLVLIVGTLLLCLTLLMVFPLLLSKSLVKISPLVHRLFGKEAGIAIHNIIPQVRSNTSVILSVVFLMVIVIFGSSLMKSIQQTEQEYLNERFETPIIITSSVGYDTEIEPMELADSIDSLPSVDFVYSRGTLAIIELATDQGWEHYDYTTIDINRMLATGHVQSFDGDLSKSVIISEQMATTQNLSIGDQLQLGYFNESAQKTVGIGTFTVGGIESNLGQHADMYVDWSTSLPLENIVFSELFVETSNIEETITSINSLKEEYPEIQVSNVRDSLEQANTMFYQRWGLLVGVFIILITATCIGVFQSLIHYIYTKRHDFAIHRLIGMTPNQLIKLIVSQTLIFIVYGLFVGCTIGIIFTCLLFLIDPAGNSYLDIPMMLLISLGLIVLTVAVFLIQGWFVSRQKLTEEMQDL